MLTEVNLIQIFYVIIKEEKRSEMKRVSKTLVPILVTIIILSFAGAAFAAELNLKKFSVSPSPF